MTRGSSTATTTSSLAVAAAIASAVAITTSYYYYVRKSKQPRNCLGDLQSNFYATGTDICRLYPNATSGLVVVVTGTSSGLGAHTAKLLGIHGAFVILGNRRPNDAPITELVNEIKQAGGPEPLSLQLDLSSLASVRKFADQVKKALLQAENKKKIHVVIHNAGVSFVDGSTEDGYQRVWQVNALAPALLTELLLPVLCPETGRVVYVSSEMHRFCFAKSIVNQCPPHKEGGKSPTDYALSKACQILQALELNDRFTNNNGDGNNNTKNILGLAVEPGLVRTQIGRHAPQWILEMEYFLLGPFFLRTIDQGCATTLFCALAPFSHLEGNGNNNHNNTTNDDMPPFYFANCLPKTPKSNSADLEEARRFKDLCYDICKSYL